MPGGEKTATITSGVGTLQEISIIARGKSSFPFYLNKFLSLFVRVRLNAQEISVAVVWCRVRSHGEIEIVSVMVGREVFERHVRTRVRSTPLNHLTFQNNRTVAFHRY